MRAPGDKSGMGMEEPGLGRVGNARERSGKEGGQDCRKGLTS